jgi:hypothetical protein
MSQSFAQFPIHETHYFTPQNKSLCTDKRDILHRKHITIHKTRRLGPEVPFVQKNNIPTQTAILIITEGQFDVFQRFSGSKLVLKTDESRFAALKNYKNGRDNTLLYRVPGI